MRVELWFRRHIGPDLEVSRRSNMRRAARRHGQPMRFCCLRVIASTSASRHHETPPHVKHNVALGRAGQREICVLCSFYSVIKNEV